MAIEEGRLGWPRQSGSRGRKEMSKDEMEKKIMYEVVKERKILELLLGLNLELELEEEEGN